MGVDSGKEKGNNKSYRRFHDEKERKRRFNSVLLGVLTLIAATLYLAWLTTNTNWDFWYVAGLFIFVEFIGILLHALHFFNTAFLRRHSPEGLPIERDFSIDVFITVCGEPGSIYEPTLRAASRISYPNKRIFVLDDKSDARLKKLSDELGFGYFARPTHEDSKAGNLNYAFTRTNSDLILTLDADQVPESSILDKLAGYFKLPWIGFVQTVQQFKVPKGDPFGDKDELFYKVVQSGRDYENSAISCGSGVLYRRKALEDIGGYSTWNIVEDVHTSMRLHEKGWKSVYHDTGLTTGTAPTDILGNYRQRYQWATDSLRIFFWDNPFGKKGLNLRQKLMYSNFGLYYIFMGFFVPFFFFVPVWSVFTGHFVVTAAPWLYIIYRIPYFAAHLIAGRYTSYPANYLKSIQVQMGYFPIYIAATLSALFLHRKKKPKYHVTVKRSQAIEEGKKFLAILPQFALLVISLVAIIYTVFVAMDFWLKIINIFWLSWTILSMNPIIYAAYSEKVWQEETDKPVPAEAGGAA